MSKDKFIDIHAHLNFKDFDGDREEIISRMSSVGVSAINIGTSKNTSIEVVRLSDTYENLYSIIGLHPINAHKEDFDKNFYTDLISQSKKPEKIVGIGECGLDFFHIRGDDVEDLKNIQRNIFRKQIEFAIEIDKPVMIHCRDAYTEVLDILSEYKNTARDKLRGNIHFFAGDKEDARKTLDLGFTISFTGVITFAPQYREIVEYVPIDKMHAETDSPYVAPVPNRGKRNEPTFVIEVVNRLAEIKSISVHDMSEQLIKNAKKTFNLPI